jgi:hypothetical protein
MQMSKTKTKTNVESESRAGRAVRSRFTVQLSTVLIEMVEARSEEEAIPVAVFVRRAVTRLVKDFERTKHLPRRDVEAFAEAQRSGRRGPMRQWPKGVTYVVDPTIAESLKGIAQEERVEVSVLVREAIVADLERPGAVRRVPPRDEVGFTTSGAPHRGRAAQHVMNEVWRSTKE